MCILTDGTSRTSSSVYMYICVAPFLPMAALYLMSLEVFINPLFLFFLAKVWKCNYLNTKITLRVFHISNDLCCSERSSFYQLLSASYRGAFCPKGIMNKEFCRCPTEMRVDVLITKRRRQWVDHILRTSDNFIASKSL